MASCRAVSKVSILALSRSILSRLSLVSILAFSAFLNCFVDEFLSSSIFSSKYWLSLINDLFIELSRAYDIDFSKDLFGKKTFITGSGQLHGETFALSYKKIYYTKKQLQLLYLISLPN